MNFDEYQRRSIETDQIPYRGDSTGEFSQMIVPLLGLAGETGELLSEYKKYLRDGKAHLLFKERVSEELGDLLWYISNVASKFELSLDDVAINNLSKVHDRWGVQSCSFKNFDEGFPENQSFPRRFDVELRKEIQDGKNKIQPYLDGTRVGDGLTDNYPEDDGYRFHATQKGTMKLKTVDARLSSMRVLLPWSSRMRYGTTT